MALLLDNSVFHSVGEYGSLLHNTMEIRAAICLSGSYAGQISGQPEITRCGPCCGPHRLHERMQLEHGTAEGGTPRLYFLRPTVLGAAPAQRLTEQHQLTAPHTGAAINDTYELPWLEIALA